MSTPVFGAPEFRARSGRTVTARSDGSVLFDHANGYLSPASVMDAEEFFQAQRDIERGLWRSPVETHHVVREIDRDGYGRRRVRVLNETTLVVREVNEIVCTGDDAANVAARGYFEAHPERKPWQDATDGHLWLIRFDDFPAADVSALVKGGIFIYNDHCHDGSAELNDPTIVAGRRIWPVDEMAPAELHESSSQAGLASIRGGL